MISLIILLLFHLINSSNGPLCTYACSDPQCAANCVPKCLPYSCHILCSGNQSLCNPINCHTECVPYYVEGHCPLCTLLCQPVKCTASSGTCIIECEELSCGWKCQKPNPSQCSPPICELQCELPSCEFSNSVKNNIGKELLLFIILMYLYIGYKNVSL